jgi:DNA topoisomerase IA
MWALSTAATSSSDAVVQIVALVVGLVQTVALAVIADRSRRVRKSDRRNASPRPREGSEKRSRPSL